MAHKYPRERRQIVTINGIFDDFSDTVFSMASWEDTSYAAYYQGLGYHTYEYVSAPGGAGGNALHLKGEIFTPTPIPESPGSTIQYVSVGPYRNRSAMYSYSPDTWGKFGIRAEFRLYIVDDEPSTQSDEYIAQSAGFCIDGGLVFDLGSPPSQDSIFRIMANFSVANQRAGVAIRPLNDGAAWYGHHSLYDVAWSGSYNTWYDIRIEWDFDWYANPEYPHTIRVYVNNTQLFETTVHFLDWRVGIESDIHFAWSGSSIGIDDSVWGIMGRCGPQICCGTATGGTVGNYVEAYYKDVLITQYPIRLINYKFKDSIFERTRPNSAIMKLHCKNAAAQIGQGSDIQIHFRNKKIDNWGGEPEWRGIIRQVNKISKSIISVEAESYFSLLTGERCEHLTYTTQTTAQIIIDALKYPTKYEFNTSDYFDTVTATYSREYQQLPKFEIVEEMLSLEGYLFYLDHGLNIHFEDPRKYETGVHLEWGVNIIHAEEEELFIQQPNIIRVNGNGVTAHREIIGAAFGARSRVVKNISRLDLETQAAVDDALNYYTSLYTNPPIALNITISPNWSLKKGQIIRVTIPHYSINSMKFLITSRSYSTKERVMTIGVLQSTIDVGAIVSDIGKQSASIQDSTVPTDTIEADEWLAASCTAIGLIQGEFEIEYDSNIVRSGKLTITNGHIERLLTMLTTTDTGNPDYIGIGTGTAPPEYADTALANETGSRVLDNNATDLEKCSARAYTNKASVGYFYRAAQWSCDFSDPSGITEIGLFDLSTGGLMFGRAVFPSYSQAGTVTFRITLRAIPKPSSVYPTSNWICTTQRWWKQNQSSFTGWGTGSFLRSNVWGTVSFVAPNPFMWCNTLAYLSFEVEPDLDNDVSGAPRTAVINNYTQTVTIGIKSTTYLLSGGSSSNMAIGFGFGARSTTAITGLWREYPLVLGFYRDYRILSQYNGKKIDFQIGLIITQGYIEDVQ